jgi:hypothetical protein
MLETFDPTDLSELISTPSTAPEMAMRTHTPIAEIARALNDRIEDVAISLLGKASSKSRGDLRWGRRGSISLRTSGEKRDLWCDFERGEGGDLLDLIARECGVSLGKAIRIAERDYLGGANIPRSRPLKRPKPTSTQISDDSEVLARIQSALRIWQETVPIPGTLAERYFVVHRKLDVRSLDLEHCMRWHAGIRAVVALMTNPVSGKPIGIHRTFLDTDGVKLERKMLGRQGVVRLSPNSEVTIGLGITEGVEDGLVVLLSGWAPVWAATSAGAIARLPVLAGIDALTIFADADPAGRHAAKACSDRWFAQGRDVRMTAPGSPA